MGRLIRYLDLIHPGLKSKDEDDVFTFHKFEEVRFLEDEVESKGESWEQMLVCTPKVRTLRIEVGWWINMDPYWREYAGPIDYFEVENPDRVTVLDVLKAVRESRMSYDHICRSLGELLAAIGIREQNMRACYKKRQ